MKTVGIDIAHAEIGTVSSRQDGSVAFRVLTPELRPSEAGVVMSWHGKACRVTITPDEGEPEELVSVETERETKTPSQRLRGVLYIMWKEQERTEAFPSFYERQMEKFIAMVKKKLPET